MYPPSEFQVETRKSKSATLSLPCSHNTHSTLQVSYDSPTPTHGPSQVTTVTRHHKRENALIKVRNMGDRVLDCDCKEKKW